MTTILITYFQAKWLFDAAFRKRFYRLHEVVSASLLHVSGGVLGGHSESVVRPRLLGHACHSTADPPGTGRRRQAGAAIGVAPHCLSAPHLVHQDERGVEETAPSGLVVRPRGRRNHRWNAAPPWVVAVVCLLEQVHKSFYFLCGNWNVSI